MSDQNTEDQVFNQEGESTQPYRRIGQGFCGSVWSCPQVPSASDDSSSTTAIKREDGGPGRFLRNDYHMHQLILQSLERCPEELRVFTVPRFHAFIPQSHPGWDDGRVLGRFPAGYTSCNVLFSERIPPMPEPIQKLLVDKFCPKTPESLTSQICADEQNQDCLVRPYLGRTKHGPRKISNLLLQPAQLPATPRPDARAGPVSSCSGLRDGHGKSFGVLALGCRDRRERRRVRPSSSTTSAIRRRPTCPQ